MEKCDHFKVLILTDYIDGQLDKKRASDLERHLVDCGDCRAFLKEVKNNAVLPSQQPLIQRVPAELWDTIKQRIEQKNQMTNPLEAFIEKLKGLMAFLVRKMLFYRMAPVFASLVLMLLVGSVTLDKIQVQQDQAKEQGEYLISLLSPTYASSQSENNGLGTPIEHYFL